MKAGGKAYRVFARVQGEEEWFEVGEVASTPESPDAACTLHKRLALEYAVDLYPKLKSKAKSGKSALACRLPRFANPSCLLVRWLK